MPSDSRRPGKSGSAPLARPFLHALDRMQERESERPEALSDRAVAALAERFGHSDAEVYTALMPSCIGLMSEHTHYFDGFALMLPSAIGPAVALRSGTSGTRVAFDGGDQAESEGGPEASGRRAAQCLPEALLAHVKVPGGGLDLSVSSAAVRGGGSLAFLASLSVALSEVLQQVGGTAPSVEEVGVTLEKCSGRPVSNAYPIASAAKALGSFVLVDTGTRERLLLEAPAHDVLGWGLIFLDEFVGVSPEIHSRRKEQTDEALAILKRNGFPGLDSFRGLEHRDLHRALDVLPEHLRPLLRYLVGENRRVQKLVAAIRRKDWQMFGALLLISYASHRNDLKATSPAMDAIVEQVEQMSIEGLHGATVCGSSQCMVVVGQPFAIPAFLDRVQSVLQSRFGTSPVSVLL